MTERLPQTPLVSIIIINYRVADFTLQALRSLRQAGLYERSEVIVVDNASQDDSREKVCDEFNEVNWIELKSNIGFGKACNVGARNASGRYLLFLNPDTVVSKNTISACVEFMDRREDVGVMGPKILDPKGRLQQSCHRSFPTPFNTFCYLSGLSALFPKSKIFGGYNLTYLNPDESTEVDAVSGSFMIVRRTVFEELGGFDELFFMYGEDLDLCARVREHGYKVWYHPQTQIVHFKGRSSAKQKLRSRMAFYEAMVLFSRKYRPTYGAFFPRWLVFVGIVVLAGTNILGSLASSMAACFIDLAVVNTVLWAAINIRFVSSGMQTPYYSSEVLIMLGLHGLMSLSFILTYAVQGVYTRSRYSPRHALISGILASTVFVASIYFTQVMAFSRISFAIAAFVNSFALVGWRELLPRIQDRLRRFVFSTGRVIVLGDGEVARTLIRNTEADHTARIVGLVWPRNESCPGQIDGYPVLGCIDNLTHILRTQRVELLLVATAEAWYSHFIEALASLRLRHLTVKWVRHDLVNGKPQDLPAVIPLEDFTV